METNNERRPSRFWNFIKNVAVLTAFAIIIISLTGGSLANAKEKVREQILKMVDPETMDEVSTKTEGNIVKKETRLTEKTIKEEIASVRKMITKEYKYDKVGHHTKSKKLFGKTVPFTTDDFLFQYSATVFVGVDLSKAKFDVDNQKKIIKVELPEADIISHEIDEDSFAYYSTKDSIFTNSKMDDYMEEVAELTASKEKELREKGTIFEEAENEAKGILQEVMLLNETIKEYEIIFE